jgi:hypothetical protein
MVEAIARALTRREAEAAGDAASLSAPL